MEGSSGWCESILTQIEAEEQGEDDHSPFLGEDALDQVHGTWSLEYPEEHDLADQVSRGAGKDSGTRPWPWKPSTPSMLLCSSTRSREFILLVKRH